MCARSSAAGHDGSEYNSARLCPIPGKVIVFLLPNGDKLPMSGPVELEDLVAYLVCTSGLTRSEVTRLLEEVLAFLDEQPEEFVCRRHRELQAEGCSNSKIFSRLSAELARRRFRAPVYTARQIRRMIYG